MSILIHKQNEINLFNFKLSIDGKGIESILEIAFDAKLP
jgi:hypothetical protein